MYCRNLLLPALALLFSLSSAAQTGEEEAPRWYQIEVALVGYNNTSLIDQENWNDVLPPQELPPATERSYPWLAWWNSAADTKALYNVTSRPLAEQPDLPEPYVAEGKAFESKLKRLNRNRDMQVLWTQTWKQPVPEKTMAKTDENLIRIDLRIPFDRIPTLEAEISGFIYLYRSRYLHIVSDLQMQHWEKLEKDSVLDKPLPQVHQTALIQDNVVPSDSSTPLTAPDEIPVRATIIQQSRRMRSNELHYIDHPMLGMLVRARPL